MSRECLRAHRAIARGAVAAPQTLVCTHRPIAHGVVAAPKTLVCTRRAIARGAVAALAFCHARGVAHGALGAACFLLSTFDDRRAGELVVKLDNFGFARMARRPVRTSSSEGAFQVGVRVGP